MPISLPDGRSESDDVLEALRWRAIHARELGSHVVDIAAILGMREETISRWWSRYEQVGPHAGWTCDPMPAGFDVHARTAAEAIRLLMAGGVTGISLDQP